MLSEIALKRVNQAARGQAPSVPMTTSISNNAIMNATGGFRAKFQSKAMTLKQRAGTQNRPPILQNIPVISYNNAIIVTTPRRSYNQALQSSPFKRKVHKRNSLNDNFDYLVRPEQNFSP